MGMVRGVDGCAGWMLLAVLFVWLRPARAAEVVAVAPIEVTGAPDGNESTDTSLNAVKVQDSSAGVRPVQGGDSARLLLESPGVSLRSNGPVSSLPVIRGLADDRLRVEVDGVELATACPNHMNSPLSYVDPSAVGKVTVFAGATPVSVGGDSIGGTVQVSAPDPQFAAGEKHYRADGQLGSFYRSNGNGFGYNFRGSVAGRWLNLTYRESKSQSDNYVAGGAFKPASAGREGAMLLPGNEVGSSAYRGATHRSLAIAALHAGQSVQLDVSRQTVDFAGFPNQRMDMTANDNRVGALRYRGQFAWGDLLARASYQRTDHAMDMGPDRYSYGTGMPMRTRGKTRGATVQGNVLLSDQDVLRIGGEYDEHTLFDWWDPVANAGSMGPNTFYNIDYGRRRRIDAFAEWEATWSRTWVSLLGIRSDTVATNAGPVQGYNNSFGDIWAEDAAAFNALRRSKTDANWDVSALLKFSPKEPLEYTVGYSRKSRSPNLYQRYAWASNPMAALMNNLAGDGNGYTGDVNLKPEVAHTLNLVARFRDTAGGRWELNATSHLTYVENYIDARRCVSAQCGSTVHRDAGFVLLQYANHNARLQGIDVSAKLLLANSARLGTLRGLGVLSYLDGKNLATDDGLYDMMPLHAKLRLEHSIGVLDTAVEVHAVAEKTHVSRVRNEIMTPSYWLLNLRASYRWEPARLDVGVENLLNRLYFMPHGGAYVGQGPSMSTTGIPWGIPVPGRGRSVDVAFNYYF